MTTPAHPSYSLEQADDDIADLRGQVALLGERLALGNSTDNPLITSGAAIFAIGGQPWYVNAQGLAVPLAAAQADTTGHTVTQATDTALSTGYSIPANDAAAGSGYRITASGTGTWGSTQQQGNVNAGIDGATVGTNGGVAATSFAISTGIHWRSVAELICTSTGVSGSFIVNQALLISNGSVTGQTTWSIVRSSTGTIDTTAAHTFAILWRWASTTGAPTITCNSTVFERFSN